MSSTEDLLRRIQELEAEVLQLKTEQADFAETEAVTAPRAITHIPEGWSAKWRQDLGGIQLQRGGTGYTFRPTAPTGSHERFAWRLLNDMLSTPAEPYAGPSKLTPQEQADGGVAIRWITPGKVAGRPSSHDVREYLLRYGKELACSCEKCTAFYPAPLGAATGLPLAGR